MNIISPKFLTGTQWLVEKNEDDTEPISAKEFKDNIDKGAKKSNLSRGNIIMKSDKCEKHLIFNCDMPQFNVIASFRIFLYDDGSAIGRIEYPITYNMAKSYFKGKYRLYANSKVTLWGKYSFDSDFNKVILVYYELSL